MFVITALTSRWKYYCYNNSKENCDDFDRYYNFYNDNGNGDVNRDNRNSLLVENYTKLCIFSQSIQNHVK